MNETTFPTNIRPNPRGGPRFRTEIAVADSGGEQRDRMWDQPLREYTVDQRVWDPADLETLLSWFHAHAGRWGAFRLRDPFDHATRGKGILGAGVGNGMPTYQCKKTYTIGTLSHTRTVLKPVAGAVITRNAVTVAYGAGAGQVALDTTTGVVSFVADGTSNASVITVGATTQVTLAANLSLVAGQLLYLTGFTGTGAGLLNGLAHVINTRTGTGPYVFTLATNTLGATITLGAGQGRKYPQATDAIAWEGVFDVPVRFDQDALDLDLVGVQADGDYVVDWAGIKMIEVRNP